MNGVFGNLFPPGPSASFLGSEEESPVVAFARSGRIVADCGLLMIPISIPE